MKHQEPALSEHLRDIPLRGTIRAEDPAPRKVVPPPRGWFAHLKTWGMWVFEPVRDWVEDRCASLSASIAFYSAFSLAPTLVLIIAIISFFYGADAAQGKLVAQIRGVVGEQAAAGIQTLISSAWNARTGTGTTVISIIVVAIGASATFSSLNTALNEICPPDNTIEGARASILSMIRVRLISFGLVIGAGFLVVVLLVLDAVINILGSWLLGADNPSFILANLAQRFVSFLILLGAFSALLKLLPDAPIPWRAALMGGTTSALLFTGGKNLFSFYLAHAGTANSFGAAGSLAVVLMWLYYSAAVFLLGAEFTAASARRGGTMAPHPRLVRKAQHAIGKKALEP